MNFTYLCVCISQRRNVRPYCWRNMQYNQMTSVNSCGLSVVRTKNVLKISNNRQQEGPAVRCRLIKIIAYML